jgi:hypothetical protein
MKVGVFRAQAIAALCLASLIACVSAGCGKPSESSVAGDDAAILKALLASICPRFSDGRFEAISDVPAVAKQDLRIPDDWKVPANVAGQLMLARQPLVRWPRVSKCPRIKIIDGERAESLIARDQRVPKSWEGLRAAYPGMIGLSEVSRPIYTREHDRAFAVMQGDNEGFSSYGALYELVYSRNEWRVSRTQTLWVRSF